MKYKIHELWIMNCFKNYYNQFILVYYIIDPMYTPTLKFFIQQSQSFFGTSESF